LAADLLRPTDKAWLYELQPSDFPLLQAHFCDHPNLLCSKADGFDALRGLLPPAPRRALAFIDPSYELQSDYDRLVESLADALRRFETGCYLVWYPVVQRAEALDLPSRLRLGSPSGPTRWLRAELRVQARRPAATACGSGLFVINRRGRCQRCCRRPCPGSRSAWRWTTGLARSISVCLKPRNDSGAPSSA
jgi:23S rRNA (adenine2030-N6)-methyltransferase